MTHHVFFLLFCILRAALANSFDSLEFKERQNAGGPWFSEGAVNLTVAEGRTATLPCVVENIGNYKLVWIHKDRHILLTLHDQVITRNPRISINHNNFRTWWLEIRDVKLEDSGQYMCQINTAPMISQTRYLEVVVPPSIVELNTSSDLNVREGADVNLQCQASGSPKPIIKWRREEEKDIILGPKRVKTVEGEYLKLKRTSRLSMGAYLCIATNGVLPSVSKRIMLNVLFAPMILIPSQLIGANIGEDVTLVCNLESHPRSVTYWVISGGIVIITNNKYRVMTEPSDSPASYKVKLKLLIRDLRPQDFGSYTCVAKNSLGETEGAISLYAKPSEGTTNSEEEYQVYDKSEISTPIETLKEVSKPIADNIKLGMPSVPFKPISERKERRDENERQMIATNTLQKDILQKIDVSASHIDSVYSSPLFVLFLLSSYLLLMMFSE
ncbi:limbic system-associated membrane protein-like isoform X1 [Parasteatoda tepidariorum]|uniref:limbic system-associated membrane protein-like isoform X1 n=1 Tax=Parasteatoda tepidariorum TaxID=114398 RepID=UPI001C72414E|nr:limbic system-associated membrane protein-like isoform X1 [Parasteatoda tepidariorum]